MCAEAGGSTRDTRGRGVASSSAVLRLLFLAVDEGVRLPDILPSLLGALSPRAAVEGGDRSPVADGDRDRARLRVRRKSRAMAAAGLRAGGTADGVSGDGMQESQLKMVSRSCSGSGARSLGVGFIVEGSEASSKYMSDAWSMHTV